MVAEQPPQQKLARCVGLVPLQYLTAPRLALLLRGTLEKEGALHHPRLPFETPEFWRQHTAMSIPASLQALPVEVTDLIWSFIDSGDSLLTLRQTCRALASETYDAFAAHYLTNLRCFVLQPHRVQNTRNIMRDARMPSRIKQLTLCVSPPSRPLPFEPCKCRHDLFTLQYQDELRWICQAHHKTEALDVSQILELLRTLRPTIKVAVDFASAKWRHECEQ